MSSSLTCTRLTIWAFAAVLLQIAGLSLFLIGFFPVKPTLPGFSGPESYRMPTSDPVSDAEEVEELPPDRLRSLYREVSKIPPVYDRLILMVIDGLPAEFVLGRGNKPPTKNMMEAMPYTHSLLSSGKAAAYHAKAAPPTVTMPRLKAMVSGAIGGFLDVAFNFNTQAMLEDNLLEQFYRIGWKLVIHGDETWIKLFPRLFHRQDGVSSFYVKDTVEVDFNVSRHLEAEFASTDWNFLILHYLGLDHVGHIGGRQSILMAPKLKEMDDVIKRIHMNSILDQENSDSHTLLVVVSDHGMTDGGNHGGSSYEETDSLALFIGHGVEESNYSPYDHNEAFQVDIAPTLALLFGVPIPKNNIGVLLTKLFDSLTDDQRLRSLELNSWQLLRLLKAHLPGLHCGESSCYSCEKGLETNVPTSEAKQRLCYLFSKAISAHNSWQFRQHSDFISADINYFQVAAESYNDFLRNASEWLSHRATDKPVNVLMSAIIMMLVSSVLLMGIVFCLFRRVHFAQVGCCSQLEDPYKILHLDEVFVFIVIFLHVLSLGASSLVEEEQYTWHFLTSTLYLIFLSRTIESLLKRPNSVTLQNKDDKTVLPHSSPTDARNNSGHKFTKFRPSKINNHGTCRLFSVVVVLICGRLLRGWHQGGVNWIYLPDISKLLVHAGTSTIKVCQILSLFAIIILGSHAIFKLKSTTNFVYGVWSSLLLSAFLVMLHTMENHIYDLEPMNLSTTSIAQVFYVVASTSAVLTFLASPWIFPVYSMEKQMVYQVRSNSCSTKQRDSFLLSIRETTYLIGTTYTAFWCLLQLLIQQPINAIPILLIYLQILFSIIYFSADRSFHRQWVEVAAIYFLGLAGHFGLGNTNSLATIDVAGAFIGISSHSAVLSGILMFVITYASPSLSYLSMVMYIDMKDITFISSTHEYEWSIFLEKMIALPCLLPLLFNSLVLTSFTIILLLMRNHLFVWSVFSPNSLNVYHCCGCLCLLCFPGKAGDKYHAH
ncbi:GPI ethanolamine phosphate transferase 2 isoform X2 [Ananas comosus]|uniref:GPI ethanolamine phosphate transferase 2 isoform X2 n=1 Tax=Ananas comosus TaxID=4615 RepID=A0A6P5GGN1_ANACO|nr:GPI ethanolamine phosphate transferase 2 isoform X2 [Ananas comosus]